MAEYIEREARLREIDSAFKEYEQNGDVLKLFSECRASIIFAPAADVVEVVRCKECRNFGEDVGMSKDGVWARCFLHKRIMCEKDYCSYGAKMDGKGEGE